jgi:hypothetical protein
VRLRKPAVRFCTRFGANSVLFGTAKSLRTRLRSGLKDLLFHFLENCGEVAQAGDGCAASIVALVVWLLTGKEQAEWLAVIYR